MCGGIIELLLKHNLNETVITKQNFTNKKIIQNKIRNELRTNTKTNYKTKMCTKTDLRKQIAKRYEQTRT